MQKNTFQRKAACNLMSDRRKKLFALFICHLCVCHLFVRADVFAVGKWKCVDLLLLLLTYSMPPKCIILLMLISKSMRIYRRETVHVMYQNRQEMEKNNKTEKIAHRK